MKKILLLLLGLLVFMTGVCYASPKALHKHHVNLSGKKILVAYFSLTGNTRSVAEKIHTQIGGDIFEIKAKCGYPSEYRLLKEVAEYQKENDILPELTETINISKYDIVFLGTPVWFGTLPPPVKTFLTENKFRGKTIVPFVTHGGGGGYNIPTDIDDLTDGKVIQDMLVIKGKDADKSDSEIKSWIKNLK